MSNKERPLVSVLLPVYNVEKYLDACIDSIEKQTYKNHRMIYGNGHYSTIHKTIICPKYMALNVPDHTVEIMFMW